MPMAVYNDAAAQSQRRISTQKGDAFRRGAKQNLQALDRTIGGNIARRSLPLLEQQNHDETPRTARAFASSAHVLAANTRDVKKRQQHSMDPAKKKFTHKENRTHNSQVPQNDTFNNNNQHPHHHHQHHHQSIEGKCNREDVPTQPTSPEGKSNLENTPTRPRRTTHHARPREEGKNNYNEDAELAAAPNSSSPSLSPSLVSVAVHSPTLTAAHQWETREHVVVHPSGSDRRHGKHGTALGIDQVEGKYEDQQENARRTDSPRKPSVSPLKSPHPNSRRARTRTPSKTSPEPDTARASQFVSNRSPAAAMARLRLMKQERNKKQHTPQRKRTSDTERNRSYSHQATASGAVAATEATEATEATKEWHEQYSEEHVHHHHHHHHTNTNSQSNSHPPQHEEKYDTPHHRAASLNVPELPNPTTSLGGFGMIFSRARHGRLNDVQTALDGGMNVNSRDNMGNTLLHIACQNGNKKLVKMLLRRHADINTANTNGNTSLHFCFMYAYYGMAEYIMSKGADGALRNQQGQTPKDVDR